MDAVVIEADGSRRLPFKAPAAHEPVIPTSTTIVVPVVGLDVVGRPLTAEHVHRPERVAALTGAEIGDPVTPAMIATVLAHPDGGSKAIPASARLVPFLNKAEDEATPGRSAGDRPAAPCAVGVPRVDSVLIGAAQAADPVREVWGRVAAVVLAAGQARRFGALKQVLPWRGIPLVAHVVQQALACSDIHHVVVTTGAESELVRSAAMTRFSRRTRRLTTVDVPDWIAGQSRSVCAGLRAAQARETGVLAGALFLLADQPGVSPELLSALIQRHRETHAPVVAPRHGDQRGNPVLFDRRTFAEFDALTGDAGARSIIRRHEDAIAWVDWPTVGDPEGY